MELSRKTTILFSPDQHDELRRLAEARGCSLGELVREAVRKQYSLVSPEQRMQAARELAELQLPVTDVEQMIAESIPGTDLPE